VVVLAVCVLALELAVRLFVDLDAYRLRPVSDIDPAKRISFLPHVKRVYETSELRFTVETNSLGRRDVEWTPETLADPDNVIFVGDSMVVGYGVDHEHVATTVMEERFEAQGEPREVFNFGLPGTTTFHYKMLLEDALARGIEARTVIVGITVGNDFIGVPDLPDSEIQVVREPAARPWYDHSSLYQFVRFRASNSTRLVGLTLTLGRLFGISVYQTPGSYIFLREQTPQQQATFRAVLEVVGDIQQLAKRHDRALYAVIFPNKIQVENSEDLTTSIYDAAKPNRLIGEYLEEIGVPYLDLLPLLRDEYERRGEPLFFAVDRHHNEAGNAFVAESIVAFLERHGVRGDSPL
jgi:hypothetical protein